MEVSSNKEEFELYINKFFDNIMFIDSTFELYIHLMNKRIDRIDELNVAPAFFGLAINSFLSSSIISLAKLYENYNGRNRSDKNIMNFLGFVEKNLDIFPKDESVNKKVINNYVINKVQINEHRDLIKENKDKLDNLFYWRDKVYAHNDKKYFFTQENLGKDAELTIKNIRELISLAKDILNIYSIGYSGVSDDARAINLYDVDYVLDILYEHNKTEKNKFN